MLRVTIQIVDDRRQMADFGSSRTADPYSVILSVAKNLKQDLQKEILRHFVPQNDIGTTFVQNKKQQCFT